MSFDTLAPYYRGMEWVTAGEKLQRCRTAFLNGVREANNILILGEGNGRFLAECRKKFPDAKITSVDASARMLALSRRRLAGQGDSCKSIDFVCADALAWTPPEKSFDLIVTHFFLDCFRPEQVEMLVAKLTQAALPRTHWLLADFQSTGVGLGRYRSRLILWGLYRFFRVVTRLPAKELTPPGPFLERNGFTLRQRQVREWGLLHSDWWQRM